MEIVNKTSYFFAPITGRLNYPGHSLSLIVKGSFDLKPGRKAEPADEQIYPTGDEYYPGGDDMKSGCRYETDFAHYKPRADILLAGSCYAPNGTAVKACRVSFRAGTAASSLYVFGDRFWKGLPGMRVISDPEPFTKMELRYENSFGGPGFEKNPVGKGFRKENTEAGDTAWPLPNIEDPERLVDSPGSRPEPAGFGPLGRMWQQRLSKMGNYKDKWLNERWPWFPTDFDMGYFNAAPTRMQVEGYLRGDEPLFFENLHPEHARYESQLPGVRVRCFLNKLTTADSGETSFSEVPMNLDTLWVDMDAEKLSLIWRGCAKVLSEDYEEIEQVFIMDEPVGSSKNSIEDCHAMFIAACAEAGEEWAIEAEEPPAPEGEPSPGAPGIEIPSVKASAVAGIGLAERAADSIAVPGSEQGGAEKMGDSGIKAGDIGVDSGKATAESPESGKADGQPTPDVPVAGTPQTMATSAAGIGLSRSISLPGTDQALGDTMKAAGEPATVTPGAETSSGKSAAAGAGQADTTTEGAGAPGTEQADAGQAEDGGSKAGGTGVARDKAAPDGSESAKAGGEPATGTTGAETAQAKSAAAGAAQAEATAEGAGAPGTEQADAGHAEDGGIDAGGTGVAREKAAPEGVESAKAGGEPATGTTGAETAQAKSAAAGAAQAEATAEGAGAPGTEQADAGQADDVGIDAGDISAKAETIGTEGPESEAMDPETVKAQAKKFMAQAGMDMDSMPPEMREQVEQEMDRIVNKVTEADPDKILAMEEKELETQLSKAISAAGLDINNLPTVSEKAREEQKRFLKEVGAGDDVDLSQNKDLEKSWSMLSAILPQIGMNPEDLTPLIQEVKKFQERAEEMEEPEDMDGGNFGSEES